MRKIIFSLFFFLMLSSAFSLSLSVNRQSVEKGLEVQFFGDCSEQVAIEAFEGSKELFKESADCAAKKFVLAKRIPMSLPVGTWQIVAESAGEKETVFLEVKNSRESAFLLIVFQRPEGKNVQRKQEIEITAEVTDSGEPVANAVVNFWGAKGEKLQLKGEGNGFYSTKYEMPFDAKLGAFELVVSAEAEKKGAFLGGERSTELMVKKALIEIELLDPKHRNIGIGEKTRFVASALYNGSEQLNQPRVFLVVADYNFEFQREGSEFALTASFGNNLIGERQLKIVAFDGAGNTAVREYVFVLQENPFRAASILLFVGIIVLMALFLYWPFIRRAAAAGKEQKRLLKRKAQLEKNMDGLQQRYYAGRVKDKIFYRQKLVEIENELTEISTRLNKEKQQ